MPNVFAFRAAKSDGLIDAGSVDADSAADARALLATRGLFVLDIIDHGPRRTQRARISDADLALGLCVLSDLLDSGLSVARALAVLEEVSPKPWRSALPAIQQSIKQGTSLAESLSIAAIEIPALVIGIVKAGEATGGLAAAMRRAADLTEGAAETRSAVRTALVYPAIVAMAGVAAIVVLVTVVLPRFALILADLGQELPASTRLVLQAANGARAALLPVSALAFVASVAAKIAFDTPEGKRWRDRTLLAVPLLGRIRRGAAVARMTQSLSGMLESGVALPSALLVAAQAGGDAELEHRMTRVRHEVDSGTALSRALATADAATPTAIRLIRSGEESGRLSAMLDHASRIERQASARAVQTFVRLIEPVLLLSFALIVAFVAAALLQAIYSVRPGVT
ncbi:MAG TPA: type II secretion system F family protein [Gemmatimonadaceae bacterium]|jgi:type II secretory pathway component PulF